jgi:hypothetical protein
MSGILDSKSRILDTIITKEGKKQILEGNLKIEYATFSDTGLHYDNSTDVSKRIYFESVSMPHDLIALEADDSGRLTSFPAFSESIKDGKILKYTFERDFISGSSNYVEILSGTSFASTSEKLLLSSVDAFKHLQSLGTKDYLFEDSEFELSNDSINFYISDEKPIFEEAYKIKNVNELSDLASDIRLSNVDNFKFLPPINKTSEKTIDNIRKNALGDYNAWSYTEESKLTSDQLEDELLEIEKAGFCKTVYFDPTSKENNLMCQFFEQSNDTLRKLDVIDFGEYENAGNNKHAFFVGRIVIDNAGIEKFIHLFTLIFG